MRWTLAVALLLPARLALGQVYDVRPPPQDVHDHVTDSDRPAPLPNQTPYSPTDSTTPPWQLPDLGQPASTLPTDSTPRDLEAGFPERSESPSTEQAPGGP